LGKTPLIVVFFLLGDSLASEFCADVSGHCSNFIGGVSRKNAYTAYEYGKQCSETPTTKIQKPGNHSKERIQHSEQGERLKSRATLIIS